MNSHLRLSLIRVGVLALSGGIPLTAGAQSATLFGGGATLPGILYAGQVGVLPPTLISTPPSNSLFAAYKLHLGGAPTVSYCQTGSGGGKKVLDGVVAANVSCTAATPGFSASGVNPSFAASDAPILQSEYAAFLTNGNSVVTNHTEPAQFPSAAGSIAVVFNNPAVSTGGSATALLTTADVCGIFDGAITNWNQLSHTPTYPSQAIKVVYRSDGSGTTFNFSNFLSANCNSSATNYNTSQNFANTGAGGSFWVIPTGTPPSNFQQASGNNGIVDTVNSITGSIGYAEAANAKARITADGGTTTTFNYAKINGEDAFANFPYPVTASLLSPDQTITGVNSDGTPAINSVSPAPTVAGCLVIADPTSYSNQSAGVYPIVAVTYLMGYESGNGADTHNIRALLASPYNAAVRSGTTPILPHNGFAPLALLDTNGNPVDPVDAELQIAGCINN